MDNARLFILCVYVYVCVCVCGDMYGVCRVYVGFYVCTVCTYHM